MLRFQHIYNSTYCHSSTHLSSHSHPLIAPPLSPVSSSSPSCFLSSRQQPYLSPLAPFLISGLFFHSPCQSPPLSQPFSLFFCCPPFPIILFPRARDGISSPYASAPTCNMLAHDKIVSTPPLPCKLQRVKAGMHQYHSPANRDRQPSTA